MLSSLMELLTISDVPDHSALPYLQTFAFITLLCLAHSFFHPLYLVLSVTSSDTTLNCFKCYLFGYYT